MWSKETCNFHWEYINKCPFFNFDNPLYLSNCFSHVSIQKFYLYLKKYCGQFDLFALMIHQIIIRVLRQELGYQNCWPDGEPKFEKFVQAELTRWYLQLDPQNLKLSRFLNNTDQLFKKYQSFYSIKLKYLQISYFLVCKECFY